MRILFFSFIFSLLLTGCFRTRSEIEGEQSQNQMRESFAEGLAQINELQGQLGQMQGRMDELEHSRRKDLGKNGEQQQDLQAKVLSLQTKIEELQKGQTALFEEIKKIREEGRPTANTVSAPATKSSKKKGDSFAAAEQLYQSKQYAEAAIAFGSIYEANPKSEQGRRSALRVAESFKHLGKDKEAKMYAQLLIESAPKSAEAKKARKFLK